MVQNDITRYFEPDNYYYDGELGAISSDEQIVYIDPQQAVNVPKAIGKRDVNFFDNRWLDTSIFTLADLGYNFDVYIVQGEYQGNIPTNTEGSLGYAGKVIFRWTQSKLT